MTVDELDILREIFRVVLDCDDGASVDHLEREEVEQWDSLATVSLAAAIESELAINIDAEDLENMISFAAVRQIVEAKRTARVSR